MQGISNAGSVLKLEQEIARGIQDGYLPHLPNTKPGKNKIGMNDELRKVVIDRLVHLQYLDSRSKVSNARFTQAVRQLQREAGLHEDGWLGFQTWQAIQQVFTFEEPTQLEKWLDDERPCDFMLRAAYVRLRALGIIEDSRMFFAQAAVNDKDNPLPVTQREQQLRRTTVDAGLRKFHQLLLALALDAQDLPQGNSITAPLMAMLFDQDRLVKLVYEHRIKLRAQLMNVPLYEAQSADKHAPVLSHALRFLGHLAKIELWLHGYHKGSDDDPDSTVISPGDEKLIICRTLSQKRTKLDKHGFSRPKRVSSADKVRLGGLLSLARSFFREASVNRQRIACLHLSLAKMRQAIFNGQVTNALVIIDILVCAHAEEEALEPSQQRAINMVKVLSNQDNKITDKDWKSVGFGNFLLDGAKRIWRIIKGTVDWVVNKVRTIVGKLSDTVVRVLKLAKQLAFKGMLIFERASAAMSEGFSLLFNTLVSGSNKQIAMKRQWDMDYYVTIDKSTTQHTIASFVSALSIKIKGFEFSVVLFKLIHDVITLVKKLLVNPIYGGLSLFSYLLTFDAHIDEKDAQILHQSLMT